MILVLAVLASFLIGITRTRGRAGGLSRVPLKSLELVFAASMMQVPLLRSPGGRVEQPFPPVSILFLLSYLPLMVFVWRNRRLPGFWLLGLGVILNLSALVANGGFMPVSPDALTRLNPSIPLDRWEIGYHRHHSKGIVLGRADSILWELSDIFVLPPPFPYPAAFSVGDVLMAGGIFVFLQTAMTNYGAKQEQDSMARSGSAA